MSALLCTAFYADNILALLNFFLECFDDLIPPEIVLELRIEIFSRAEQVSLGMAVCVVAAYCVKCCEMARAEYSISLSVSTPTE